MPPQCYLINLSKNSAVYNGQHFVPMLGVSGWWLLPHLKQAWLAALALLQDRNTSGGAGFRLAPQFILSLTWRRRRSSYLGCVLFKENHNYQEDQPNIQVPVMSANLVQSKLCGQVQNQSCSLSPPTPRRPWEKGVFIMPLEENELWWVFSLWSFSSVLCSVFYPRWSQVCSRQIFIRCPLAFPPESTGGTKEGQNTSPRWLHLDDGPELWLTQENKKIPNGFHVFLPEQSRAIVI